MIYGLNFNGKHSITDLNLIMDHKYIQAPPKTKIKLTVPFMNYFYDFSTVATNGVPVFTSRTIEVQFGLLAQNRNKEDLQVLYTNVMEWLLDTGKQRLIFDDIKDYYFMAEVEQISSWDELQYWGNLKIEFVCEPFRTSIDFVGADIWDTFNFEEDITQTNTFNIVGTKIVTLYNARRLTMPTVNCSAAMSIIVSGITYNLVAGDNINYGLTLANGYNSITINGTGTIKFLYKKVVI